MKLLFYILNNFFPFLLISIASLVVECFLLIASPNNSSSKVAVKMYYSNV